MYSRTFYESIIKIKVLLLILSFINAISVIDLSNNDDVNPENINSLLDNSKVIFSDVDPSSHVRHKRDTGINNSLSIGNNSGLYLACESTSTWVANKTTVYDREGNKRTLLKEITHNSKVYYQYMLETKCVEYPAVSGCLGTDTRFWNSYCTTSHSFVNSIVLEDNGNAVWDYVRIDASCICVVEMKCKNNTLMSD
ncbi:CNPV099 beta-NGF-like protein [Canarypox virus]|uniref:CNPV099 beta-NGF-like protein n=1 Tax=Canarypox virus TaxID=44088 RepID=Q6VZP8_CNPV|nr:CNPV099 beta-NGF-like protein [Canarypox virus]AAR83445.1 CNPV099 beta-NGF-like protein [Canarypox virus]AWD84575.1 beta-NGF-like protein [Canarypox virus]